MPQPLSSPRRLQRARLTVRVPTLMQDDIRSDMIRRGYGKKQQSQWIEESIEHLCNIDHYPELVAEDFMDPGSNKPIRISINGDTEHLMNEAIRRIEQEEKISEVQSKLVRAAIRYRLIQAGLGI